MSTYTFNAQLPLWSFEFQSSSKVQILTRKDIETKLISKSFKEEGFKMKLMADPKNVIEQLFSILLPEKVVIQVLAETENIIYMVLPHNPYMGIPESEIRDGLGIGLEEVAAWVLGQQNEFFADDIQKNARIVAKAWMSNGFKNMLKADPIVVLEAELNEKFEGHKDMQVLEETDENIFIIIPHLSDSCLYENEVDTHFINKPIILGSFPRPGSTINVQSHCL